MPTKTASAQREGLRMVVNMETLLVASLIGNIVTEVTKVIFQKPTDDAKIDALHQALNDALGQLRQFVK